MYKHEKNQLISSIHSWDTADFRVSRPKRTHPFLANTIQKLLKQLLNFQNFYQQTKNQLTSLIPSWDTANFSVLRSEWSHPFLMTLMSILFNQLLISLNLHQYAKNQASSSFHSRDIVNVKILQSNWSKAFWPISQELDLSQVWDSCKNRANITNFFYRPNSEKIKD